ncbi:HAD family hydrolase [Chrysiogenes arsenatis]|uniref:HAD family hydrolase n=1 Tax=Chrysiogenes arsenatis TaxID=309797 RepID=UPI00041AA0A3|nr:HAD-IIIA family hydrolase [Chrysiogenes arsenatis]
MSYAFYLFDLDGTLVDSLPDLTDSLNYTAIKIDYPKRFTMEQVRDFVGDGLTVLLRRAFPEYADVVLYLRKIFHEYYADNCNARTLLYDGVLETLETLHESGVALAVVTNKPEEFTHPILRRNHMHHLFHLIYGGDTFRFRKPDPEIIRRALNKVNIVASESLMVGDSINDIQAAAGAGVDSVLVTYGYGKLHEITPSPTFTIDTFPQILTL